METPDSAAAMPTPVTTLLLCELCDKPFTKELQYKRHTAYCRKSQGRKRPRSCRACNQSKIKCNSGAPCHQCIRKGVKCTFDGANKKISEVAMATAMPETTPIPSDLKLILPDLEAEVLDHSLENDDLLSRIDGSETVGFAAIPESQYFSNNKVGPGPANRMSWNDLPERAPFATTATLARTTPSKEDDFMTLFNNTYNNATTNKFNNDFNYHMDDSSYYFTGEELTFSPTLPPTTIATSTREDSPSTEVVNRKPFTKNYVESAIQQTCATMIIEMIFAYPRMMTRRETLPPFMHAFSPADDTDNAQNKLPGHLVNCMAIAQLFAVRTADTQSFVGTTIQAEIRGFRSRLSTFNAYDSMSALQACLLYLVIRAVEDAPQEAKDDIEMLLIYDNVCQRAMETVQGSCQTTNNSPDLRWKDWIFMESIRRIGCVWFVLGLVFHIRTGKPCFLTDHYREILLPCTKSEWEAKTEGEWKKENEIAAASNGTALQTFGDLIDAHRHLPGSQMFDKLARWNAGVDNLGVMLNLAVRMV